MSPLRKIVLAACSACVTLLSVAQAPLCVDPSFQPAFLEGEIAGIDFMSNGQVLVGGLNLRHPAVLGWKCRFRLNADGSLDTSFDQVVGSSAGRIQIWNDEYFFQNTATGVFRAFLSSGTTDTAYSVSFYPQFSSASFSDYHIFPDGKQWRTGWYSKRYYDEEGNWLYSEPGYTLLQVLPDGSLDLSFDPKYTAPGRLTTIFGAPDGRFLIGCGGGTQYEGHPVGGLIRTWPDASLDTTFNTTFLSWGRVTNYYFYPDGRMLAFGDFVASEYPEDTVNVLRLHPDGSVDASWPNINFRYEGAYFSGFGSIYDYLEIEPGKLIVVGEFDHVNGQPAGCIAVIDTAGNVLWDYFPGAGVGLLQVEQQWPHRYLRGIDVAPDGFIYVHGKFQGFDDGCSTYPDQTLIARLYPLDVGVVERPGRTATLHAWPNPGSEQLYVDYGVPGVLAVSLRDAQGRVVLQNHRHDRATALDVSTLSAGIYSVLVTCADGSKAVTRWIKQ